MAWQRAPDGLLRNLPEISKLMICFNFHFIPRFTGVIKLKIIDQVRRVAMKRYLERDGSGR